MNDALITSAIRGDREALEHLLDKFRNTAFSIAFKFVKDQAEAEDVVQEAFIKVFLNIDKFRSESAFSTWLYRIVYVESIRHLRKNDRMQTIYDNINIETDQRQENNEDYEIEIGEKIKDAMEVLSEREYVVTNLFYFSEKSINEVALITNQSIANIKVILHRARKKMLNHLSRQS